MLPDEQQGDHRAEMMAGSDRQINHFAGGRSFGDGQVREPAGVALPGGAMDTAADFDMVFGGRFRATRQLKESQGVATLLGSELGTGRPVVIKTTAASHVSASIQQRLEHEALVLGALASPGLTPLLAVGREHDRFYLVTPFIAGPTLEQCLARRRLTTRETVTVGQSLLAALQEVHEHGVLHRDVKPANVIVDDHEPLRQAVLIDFGLARSARLAAGLHDLPAGTVRYMSPEQAGMLDRGVDARSDLYSVGVLLFECLCGRAPFEAHSVREVLRLHLTARPPEMRAIGLPVPAALDDLVQRLLRKDPRDRYQSAAAALADLEVIAGALDRGDPEPVLVLGALDRRQTITEPAFIGRRSEIEALDAAVCGASGGEGGLIRLESESGGGKTWLLDEVARRSTRKGSWVLRGQGRDQAAQRPFQVLEGVTDELVSALGSDRELAQGIARGLGGHLDTVGAIFPHLAGVLRASPSVGLGPEEYAEARGLPALAALLDALGTPERPAVVLLDDCQWADELSIRLLGHWERDGEPKRRRRRHVLLVAAFRSEEVPVEHSLRQVPATAHLVLSPFGLEDVRDLVESMAGAVPEAAVDVVARLADGSPLMAAAVLRGLVEVGALVPELAAWRIEPGALASVQSSRRAAVFLTRRLELLPPTALAFLSVAAVLGKVFDLEFATVLSGQTPAEALASIQEARRRHLVWLDAAGARGVFVHDKLREALLDRLWHEERTRLHLRAAERLESTDPGRVFELAYHFDAAGQDTRALPYALAAADLARSRYSLEIAERQYRIAEHGAASGTDAIRQRVAEGLGEVLMLRGRYDDAGRYLELARCLAQDRAVRAEIEGRLGELAFKRGDPAAASRAIERGLRLLGRCVPRTGGGFAIRLAREVWVQALHTLLPRVFLARRSLAGAETQLLAVRLYSRLAYAYWFHRGKVPCAWAHLREMNLAERYPPTAELAQAYSEHAPVMTMIPWFRRGIAYAERSLAIRRARDDVWGQGQSLHFYGVVLYAASRFAESIERCRAAVKLLERTGDRWEVNTAGWHIALGLYRLGDMAGAVEAARGVYQAGREIGDRQACGISLGAWAKASGGRVPESLVRLELERPSEDVHTRGEVLQAEALRHLGEGRPAEAARALEEAQRLVDRAGLRQEYVAPILPWWVTALRRDAEQVPAWATRRRRVAFRRAAAVARRACRLAARYRNNLPHALREAGLVAALLGRPRRARRLLDRSLAEALRQGARHEQAQTLVARAQLGRDLGWPGAERDEAEGREAFQALGAVAGLGEAGLPEEAVTLSLADRFEAVLEAGRGIATALTRDAVFAAVREAALLLIRGEHCLVLEVTAQGGTWQLRPGPAETALEYSRSLACRALDTGRPAVIVDGLVEDAGDSLVLGGVRSALAVPILVRNVPAACLYLAHREVGGLFGADEELLAEYVATLAGAALENAEGFARIEALLADRREAEERFRALIEHGSDIIAVLAPDGSIRYLSPSVERLLGYRPDELVHRVAFDYIHPDDLPRVRAAFTDTRSGPGPARMAEFRFRHRDGGWRLLEAIGQATRDQTGSGVAIVNCRDVTERRALEDRLQQAQRMEVIGRLAGGIAHDFNNLLTVITGRCQLLLTRVGGHDPARSSVEQIDVTANRAATLVRQLLAFGRRQVLRPRVLDLGEIVAGMEDMLRRLLGEAIELVSRRQSGLWRVNADPGQLEQVIVNLVMNARDAMPGGGRLTIELANAEHCGGPHDRRPDLPSGSCVMLAVSDTGVGMDADTQAQIFEPFFTAKRTRQRTGLGLASVYGIVKQSGGHIDVESAPGQGATFRIYLPRAEEPIGVAETAGASGRLATTSRTVLLVEDDEAVRALAGEMLEEWGYTVLEAPHGPAALRLAALHETIDVLVTDVVMPGMSGPELAVRLRASQPGLRIVFMSGYADDALPEGVAAALGPTAFVQKPFKLEGLARVIRELLETPPLPESGGAP
jgi:PAS domain S-box-containing protein